ncbi:tRNA 2-thiocytidine biosynthesis protein TtcA [uncultured archaeon]|nr:tRNA 2-thiocytidine biosynthesis protein TtcA [uncultured archaeon]
MAGKDTVCSLCKNKAVAYLPYAEQRLCNDHFAHSVERRAKRTVREYKMLDGAKHIAVAMSGGKDSQVLLYLLHEIASPMGIRLTAILVDEGIKGYREKVIPEAKSLCKELKVPLKIVTFKRSFKRSLDDIMKLKRKGEGNLRQEASCTYCGVLRRWLLNKATKEIGADRLALGHNLDDMAQSYMMNMLRNEQSLMRLNPVGGDAEAFVMRIRPLFRIPEKEIALYAVLKGFKSTFVECPYVVEGFRPYVRGFINDLESKYPGTKFKLLNSYLSTKDAISVAASKGKRAPNSCGKCGEPTSGKICKCCELIETLK